MLNDDIVGEETRNDRRKHKPRVTGGSQWESGATAVPLFRFILLFHDDVFSVTLCSQCICTRGKRGQTLNGMERHFVVAIVLFSTTDQRSLFSSEKPQMPIYEPIFGQGQFSKTNLESMFYLTFGDF